MVLFHSMDASLVVGTLIGGRDTQTVPGLIKFELLALPGSEDAKTSAHVCSHPSHPVNFSLPIFCFNCVF